MVGFSGFFGRADTAAGDNDIRAGDDNAIGEHVVRRLGLAGRDTQAE